MGLVDLVFVTLVEVEQHGDYADWRGDGADNQQDFPTGPVVQPEQEPYQQNTQTPS